MNRSGRADNSGPSRVQLGRSELKRTKGLDRYAPLKPTGSLAVARPKPKPISPASKHQRQKVRGLTCLVCGKDRYEATIDPAHLWPRGKGGCDSALCVVPLCREHHSLHENGGIDLSRHLVGTYVEEVQHALGHTDGSLTLLLQELSGERWVPVSEMAA